MIHKIKEMDWLALVGKLALCAFPPFAVAGIVGLLLIKQYPLLILGTYLLVPIIATPLVYLAVRRRAGSGTTTGSEGFKLLVAAFLLFFSFSAVLLYASEVRPLLYYAAVAIMATIVFVEIVRARITPDRTKVILLQVAALSLNISFGITLKYFEFIGRTDIFLHSAYMQSVVQLGHVTTIFEDYQPFPLWHILNACIYTVGGLQLPAFKEMEIVGGLIFALLPALIYLIALKVFRDDRTALLAALITAFFPDMIMMGISTIASVIAEILIVLLVYVMLSRKGTERNVLLLPLTVAIVLYHSVSILFLLSVLIVLYVLQRLFVEKEDRFVSLGYIVFVGLLTFVYWEANAGSIIKRVLTNLYSPPPQEINLPTALLFNQPFTEFFNYLQNTPSVLFILAGIFLLLATKTFSRRARIFGLASLIFMWLAFPGPLLLVGKLAKNFNIDRFGNYTFLLLIPVCAVGLYMLYTRSQKYGKVVIVGLFCLWVLLAVSNDWVASDNPLVKRPFYTFYFSEQEITGFERLATHTTGILESDYVPNRYYESSRVYQPNTTILEVDPNMTTFLRGSPEDVFLIRAGEHDKRELKAAVLSDSNFIPKPEGDYFAYVPRDEAVWQTLANYSRIYDSRAIQAYN